MGMDFPGILGGNSNSEIASEESMDQESAAEKAYIIVYEACTIDGGNFGEVQYKKDEIIPAQFNPTEYSIRVSSKYDPEKSGISQNSESFGKFHPPEPSSLSVKFFYDSVVQVDYLDKVKDLGGSAKKAVSTMSLSLDGILKADKEFMDARRKYDDKKDLNETYIRKLINLARFAENFNRPPLIGFHYGSMHFVGYAEGIDANYIRFNKEGAVIRTEINLTIHEASDTSEKENGLQNSSIDMGKEDEPLGYGDLFDLF